MKFCKATGVFSIAVIFFFMLGSCRKPVNQVDYWKAKILESHGGEQVLNGISNLVYQGKIMTMGDHGRVTLVLSRSGKLRATMQYNRRHEDRILIGNRGWRDFGEGFGEAADHSLAAMVFQYNHLNLPMGLLDDKFSIQYSEQDIDGRNYPILELTAEEKPSMTVIINPETGLIRQVNGRISMGKNEVVMGVGYGEYEEVDGVMLPRRIINYVNGRAIAESLYESVVVNSNLDPESFSLKRRINPR